MQLAIANRVDIIPLASFDKRKLKLFDWQTDSENSTETWRRIGEASLEDSKGVYISMLDCVAKSKKKFYLTGSLLPPNENAEIQQSPFLRIAVEYYSLDVGTDDAKGLWLKSKGSFTYYKIVNFSAVYNDSFGLSINRFVEKFDEFFDAIVRINPALCPMGMGSDNKRSSELTVTDFYRKYPDRIDIDFVYENKKSFVDNLDAFFNPRCKLMRSILNLTSTSITLVIPGETFFNLCLFYFSC